MSIFRLLYSVIPQFDRGHSPRLGRVAVGARTHSWTTRIRRSLILVGASGVVVSGLIMAPSAGAATAPASTPAVASLPAVNCGTTTCYFRYRNQADSLCMRMPSTASGTQATQATCSTSNFQYWKLVPTNIGYQIRNRGSGLCLAAANSRPAAAVVQGGCSSTNRLQNWFLGGAGVTFVFYNIGTAGNCGGAGECAIHPSSNSRTNGTKLYVQTPTSNCTLTQSNCFYAWVQQPGGLG